VAEAQRKKAKQKNKKEHALGLETRHSRTNTPKGGVHKNRRKEGTAGGDGTMLRSRVAPIAERAAEGGRGRQQKEPIVTGEDTPPKGKKGKEEEEAPLNRKK